MLHHMLISGNFKDVRALVESDRLISTDKYLRGLSHIENCQYSKRDFLFFGGVWRNEVIKAAVSLNVKSNPRTLVVGHSDLITGRKTESLLRFLGVKKLYGVNTLPITGFSRALPLGLTNDCDDSPVHRIIGDEKHLLRASETSSFREDFDTSILVNFTSANNSSVREKLLEILKPLESRYRVSYNVPEFTERGRINYLQSCRESSLVLCPEGNGPDTHRLWEVLYMGGTPIVTTNELLDSLYDALPVIKLRDWSELARSDFIADEWMRIKSKTWDSNLLDVSYWLDLIVSK